MTNSKKKSKQKPNEATVNQVTEYIKKQPDDVQEKVADMLLARRVESMSYSGPIPHPMLLKEFNDVIPNGADRMAEKQSEHRINIEDKVVNANNRDSFLGVVFAGIIAILIVLGAIFLIYNKRSIQGFAILIGASATYIGVFLKSKSSDNKSLEKNE